jgi:hypothetical protein
MSLAVKKVASANGADEINTLVDLLEALSDQLDNLQNDEVGPAAANAVCKKAGKIIRSACVQLKCHKYAADLGRFFQSAPSITPT